MYKRYFFYGLTALGFILLSFGVLFYYGYYNQIQIAREDAAMGSMCDFCAPAAEAFRSASDFWLVVGGIFTFAGTCLNVMDRKRML
jgi:hypothetical protein